MHRSQGGGRVAARSGTPTGRGDQRQPLIRRGESFRAPEMQRPTTMIEHRQHRMRLFGHPQRIPDRHQTAGRGAHDTGLFFELGDAHGQDRGDRQPAVTAEHPPEDSTCRNATFNAS